MSAIHKYMGQLFNSYKKIQNAKYHDFWDVIVLTTFDEIQKDSFEKQILELFANNHFLKEKLIVVADPPDQKLGCGGSTLHVLKILTDMFGTYLYEKKILIIHSGGCSQRLPSYSIQGKIFSPIPIEEFTETSRVFYMLDLKLALYLPFCQCLGPGVFVTCGDDIETYYVESGSLNNEDLKTADVVALAHPCDLNTATGHGVYVLPDLSTNPDPVIVSDCIEVLQKPSVSLMEEKNAIIINSKTKDRIVYSDSVFWMSEKVYQPLVSWFAKKTIDWEIDAYGHFLPCLGTNMKNCKPENFSDCRKELFPILKNSNFKVIVLKDSKFYHLGSMEEYLTNFTANDSFIEELSLVRNSWSSSSSLGIDQNRTFLVVSCSLRGDNLIQCKNSSRMVIEWCTIAVPISVCGDLILSNCVLARCDTFKFTQNRINFDGNFLYHTVPITYSGKLLYVTVAFEINSDLKQETNNIRQLYISSVPLDRVLQECNLNQDAALANGKPFSLWNLKIFLASFTPEESFWRTHHFISRILSSRDGSNFSTNIPPDDLGLLFSMKDLVELKDLTAFLRERRSLHEAITDHRNAI